MYSHLLMLLLVRSTVGVPAVRPARLIRALNWTSSAWNVELDGPQVELYALGVGPDVDTDELSVIASPLPQHVLTMNSVETFAVFSRRLHTGPNRAVFVRLY